MKKPTLKTPENFDKKTIEILTPRDLMLLKTLSNAEKGPNK